MAKRKCFNDYRKLTQKEIEELAVPLSSSSDEEDPGSGSEIEDNLEKDFSPSESEYEPGISDAESTDSEPIDFVLRKKYKRSVLSSHEHFETVKINNSHDNEQPMESNENQLEYSETLGNHNNNKEQFVLEDEPEQLEADENNLGGSENISEISENNEPTSTFGSSLRGKNGHRWCTVANRRKRISNRNIVHIVQGPFGTAREAQTPLDAFLCLLNESILGKILIHTNTEIRGKSEKYKIEKATNSETNRKELNALLGLLVFAGAQKDNHLNTREMFDYKISGSIYRATMSCERFNFLLENLRFDDKTTRIVRRQQDRFAPIRDIWEEFISNCNHSYIPGSYITIDEQLLGFRGRCPFRMYIPSKPSKYGIKIVMCCDVGTKYMFAAEPYLGKNTDTKGLPLGEYYVKKLTKSIHGSNRNITMDNWFTSINLAEELLKPSYKLTIVGTLRHNKREVPPEMINLKHRELGNSIYCYDGMKTLVSIKTKINKSVLILSFMHESSATCPDTGKPEMNIFYNQTKGGVDAFDQMCGSRSCSRKTRRWPLCVFYGMLNMACINSWIILDHSLQRSGKKKISRKDFMINLHEQLTKPWLEERVKLPTLQRSLKNLIGDIIKIPQTQDQREPAVLKRTTCFMCPSKKRRMTSVYCKSCNRAFCAEHRARCCVMCNNEN